MSSPLQLPCPSCHAPNRVPAERLDDVPVCGRCKARLLDARPVVLDDKSFERYVKRSSLPVLVDFWAPWCAPCRSMAPQFERGAQDHLGRVLFAKLDTDAAKQTAARFKIQSIPTLILFRAGREVDRRMGAMNSKQIAEWLARAGAGGRGGLS